MESALKLQPDTGSGDGGEDYRLAPHNLEAEQALLGAILVNNEACDRVSNFLQPEHFYEGVHARIYEAAATRIRAGQLASPVTLKTYFEQDDTLQEIGGRLILRGWRHLPRRSSMPRIMAARSMSWRSAGR
jgi:hypothetical protein